jgi:riboflavin kinase/FMN adenylyltransferase
LGHQKLLKLAKSYKKKYNLKIGVINFDPMPKMFFNKSLKNFRFGNKREGNVRFLIQNEEKHNYQVIKPKPFLVNKKIVSSSLIRNYLEKGFLERTNKLLNRKWSIEGMVQKGRQVGKKIGFPTCNIDIKDYILAKPGVYAVRVSRKNNFKALKGIANLGFRPTFNQKKFLLEVHLFNFSGNLYNKYLSV